MRRDRTGPGGARPGRGGETEHLASPSLGATASLWALPGPPAWPNPGLPRVALRHFQGGFCTGKHLIEPEFFESWLVS